MKKILTLLIFVTSLAQAQYSVRGTMTPPEKTDWIILQKLEGTKPKFISNTSIKKETLNVGGNKQEIGRFEFTIPADAKQGMYRVTYRNTGAGFIDFLFNNEDIEMVFNPQYPEESVVFTKSLENKTYRNYLDESLVAQRSIDSIQFLYIKTKDKGSKKNYKKALDNLENIQNSYENKSKGMLANHFIKASKTDNSSYLLDENKSYLNAVSANFFNNVNFKSKELYNSSLPINKIVNYIFLLKTSENQQKQQELYKESIPEVMRLVSDKNFKKQITEYLITLFTERRNSEIVDWLFNRYYNTLPSDLQDANFRKNKLEALRVSVGRTAPDFSWTEGTKKYKLSTLNDGEKYLLVFWSTGCSHCVEEVPEVHSFMEKHKEVSVVAFAIEENEKEFNAWVVEKLPDWHNVLGTNPSNKFENKTVQDYLISATPTYFVLDKNKKIIAVPNTVKDVEDYFKN